MLTLMSVLVLTLTPANGASPDEAAAQIDLVPRTAHLLASADEPTPEAGVPGRSARLFSEPRVGAGTLVARMGMGLLFGGVTAAGAAAFDVVLAFAGASPPALVAAIGLTAVLTTVATALGSALFGRDFGRDFVDSLVVAGFASLVGVVLFTIGFFAPVVLIPMLALSMTVAVVGVPLVVQALKAPPDGPEPAVALLQF